MEAPHPTRRPVHGDRCRYCGEAVRGPVRPDGSGRFHPIEGVAFADGGRAHRACFERAELERLAAAGRRAVAPGLAADPAEVWLRGEGD